MGTCLSNNNLDGTQVMICTFELQLTTSIKYYDIRIFDWLSNTYYLKLIKYIALWYDNLIECTIKCLTILILSLV